MASGKPTAAARKRSQASKKGWETRRAKVLQRSFEGGFADGYGSGELPTMEVAGMGREKESWQGNITLPFGRFIYPPSMQVRWIDPPKPTLWQRLTTYLSSLRNVG